MVLAALIVLSERGDDPTFYSTALLFSNRAPLAQQQFSPASLLLLRGQRTYSDRLRPLFYDLAGIVPLSLLPRNRGALSRR